MFIYKEKVKKVCSFIRNGWSFLSEYLKNRKYLQTILVFSFFFIVFCWVYFSVPLLSSGDDHFFHFRFAEILRNHGFFKSFTDFKSIFLSNIAQNKEYVIYYNFLFYLIIIPFTYIQPLFLGIKLYAIIAAAIVFTAMYVVVRYFKVKYAFWWIFAIFGIASTSSIYRLLLSRPYVLAPVLLIVLLILFHKKKYVLVGIISFFYLYWYNATFFFPLVAACAYFLFEKVYYKKNDWGNIIATGVGITLAALSTYLVAPGFFLYMRDIILGDVLTLKKKIFIPEGTELYPMDVFNYISSNIMFFSGLIIVVTVEIYTYIKLKSLEATERLKYNPYLAIRATIFFLSICFFAGAIIQSGRFSDYLLLFFGLYIVLSLSSIVKDIHFVDRSLQKVLMIGLIVAASYLFVTNALSLQQAIANGGTAVETFEGIGGWLNSNTSKGDVVFDTNWSWFAQLYYYSPYNNYVVGIEPRFLYTYSPRLYWEWLYISNYGYVCDTDKCPETQTAMYSMTRNPTTADQWYKTQGDLIALVLLNDFKSSYIVTSYQYPYLNAVLDHNNHFKKVYGGNRVYYIYSVKL